MFYLGEAAIVMRRPTIAGVPNNRLQAKALHLAAYEAQYNEEHHIVSDCSLATAPNPACVNSVCVDSNQSP